MSLLEVEAINSFYGDSHILFDVSLRVEQNEVVALLGRNGAGKTTTLRTIMGVLAPGSAASGWMASRSMGGRRMRSRAWLATGAGGTGDLRRSDGRGESAAGALTAPNAWSLDRIYAAFPRLGSGGGRADARCRAASSRCWRLRGR